MIKFIINKKKYFFILNIIIFLDIISKFLIKKITIYGKKIYISKYFNLFYINNYGIAFGYASNLGKNKSYILIIIEILLLIIINFIYLRKEKKINMIGLSFINGGSISNIIDRILYKKIIDFIDFHINTWHYPIFNLADIFIFIGTILIIKNILYKKTF